MKLKSHLRILIILIFFLPFTSLAGVCIHHYLTSPERYLMKGYREISNMENLDFSDNILYEIEKHIRGIPPGVEIAVIYNEQILISNIPELEAGSPIKIDELFNFVRATNQDYDYQIQHPIIREKSPEPSEGKRLKPEPKKNRRHIMFLSRTLIEKDQKSPIIGILFYPGFTVLIIFEFAAIFIIIKLSRSLTSSITFVEETAEKLAKGNTEGRISTDKVRPHTNEIIRLVENLEKMRKSLKDSEERKSKFIMGISHDLRTPIALIKGYTEAIHDGMIADEKELDRSVEVILHNADSLENMINDLIDYVKLNSEEWLLTLQKIPLKPVIQEFFSESEAMGMIYRRNIYTKVDILTDILIPFDKNLLLRVLGNIRSNAIRYTKDGDTIELTAVQNESTVTVTISDTGMGIAEKDLNKIFDLFYRGSSSRREAGNGIGLSVVKTVVDTMGWSIDVKSEEGKGSSFIISIPYES